MPEGICHVNVHQMCNKSSINFNITSACDDGANNVLDNFIFFVMDVSFIEFKYRGKKSHLHVHFNVIRHDDVGFNALFSKHHALVNRGENPIWSCFDFKLVW